MSKRGENIYKRKDGRWEGRAKKAASETGYKSVYGRTYKEVKEKMEDYKREQPLSEATCSFSMKEASEIWVIERKHCWKPTTYRTYRQILDKYILPSLDKIKINKIDKRVLENFRLKLVNKKNMPLSNNYQFYICSLVIRIISYIKKTYNNEIQIPDNPVTKDKKGKIKAPGEHALSVLENYLMENAKDDTCLGIAIALYTGIRIGELCALKWEDVDMEEGIIHIRKNAQRVRTAEGKPNKTEVVMLSPKSADSVREVPIAPVLRLLLEKHQSKKTGFLIPGAKNAWTDTRTLQYRFKRILQKCGTLYFNFHMLRHAFATRCVEMGFDIKSLSEILGHSSVQITMSLYVHPTMQQKKQLMDRFVPSIDIACQAAG